MFRMSYTSLPIEAAIDATVNAGIVPCRCGFVDSKGLRSFFGISRSHGYHLADAGLVKTVCLKKAGNNQGQTPLAVPEHSRVFAGEH